MTNGVINRFVSVLAVALCVGLLGGVGFAQGGSRAPPLRKK